MTSTQNLVKFDTKNFTSNEIESVIAWCNEQFGSGVWHLETDWPSYYWRFYLPNTDAEVLFRLRWQR